MPVLPATAHRATTHSPEETRALGARLGVLLEPGDVVCLQGDLGAGKTTFVQGLAHGWGALDAVSSPTFIIVNVYRGALGARLFHLDTYRLGSAPEAEELDIDAMLAQGPLIVEWPERMQNVLPPERLWITIEHIDEMQRAFAFEASGARANQFLERIRNA